jgi:hypothetical protein
MLSDITCSASISQSDILNVRRDGAWWAWGICWNHINLVESFKPNLLGLLASNELDCLASCFAQTCVAMKVIQTQFCDDGIAIKMYTLVGCSRFASTSAYHQAG